MAEECRLKAKRIAGTVNDSVEKFLYKPEGGGAVWGRTLGVMDTSVDEMFAELWLLDTFSKTLENSNSTIRKVWNSLDGTRGLQYARAIKLPGGFKDRLFDIWLTWDLLIGDDGRKTYIIAFAPIEKYAGTRNKVSGAAKKIRADSTGVHIVRELTGNTCEWTRAQQVDLKFKVMPSGVLDFLAKQHLGWADDMQEKFRRNGKVVDREAIEYLAKVMRANRGLPLLPDQQSTFDVCMELQADALTEEGWKALEAPRYPDVKMKVKYFAPNRGERSIATGKAIGVIDCTAEEAAAWAFDFCSNERCRISKSVGNPARLELKNKARLNERSYATVKSMPFFLDNREMVSRQIWKTEEGKVWIASTPIEDVVDYGAKLK
ncbi:hypothetical protein TrST_g12211 [Triparma strigata]|uniref:Uncharacterized protein n=1 Tax=Triparma strigata TaxID=1606541 RepID=A0A9W7EL71_9STRA|nr:hypothetical protein TrST_g12211 [Triparma strigata]